MPRRRLSTSRSFASPTEVATAGYAEKRHPIAIAVGAANCMTRRPVSSSMIAFPAASPMSHSHTSGMPNEKMSVSTERA